MNTHRIILRHALLLTLVAGLCAVVAAQDKSASPASGFQSELSAQVGQVQKQIMDLEAAIPQAKVEWRPGEGVRSIGEVYLHIAFANYFIPKLIGFEPPADAGFSMDGKKWEGQTTDKAKIASIMKSSFDNILAIAAKLSNADLEKKVNLFGTEMTTRAAFMVCLSHLHEHLGQSIAYARMNGVVPPWTAEQQKAESDTMKKMKK